MGRFEDKVVLVTGGCRNTGVEIAAKFRREGARVYVCDIGVEPAPGRFACDISDAGQVTAMFDAIAREAGRLDVLVNNAADQGIGRPFVEMDAEYLMRVLGVNVKGGFQVTQQAVNRFFLRQETRGVVVFLTSNTARRAIRNRTAYCTSKGAINSMVRALALDLGPLGIRVNACAPGYIYTARWETLAEASKARRRLNCPLRREAKGADIANVVAFLASDDSSNMTGEIVTCDGGCSCQHMPEDVDV